MKKTILITSGIFILLIVLLLWVYLMLFGAPEDSGEVFANLGFQPGGQDTTITTPVVPTDTPSIESLVDTNSPQQLRQLTTRPVAGFVALGETASSSERIRYAERGTGHIYEIDLVSGEERQVSVTTIPQVNKAVFYVDGSVVALTSSGGYTSTTYVGTITPEGTLTGVDLQPNATDLTFIDVNTLRYTVSGGGLTIGYEQNLATNTRGELFRFNYENLDTLWGEPEATPIIATKPARDLTGFMYEITGNSVTPALPSAYGLTGFLNSTWFILTYTLDGQYQSVARSRATAENIALPILALKEKCTFDSISRNYLWCAAPVTVTSTFVEDWYKGVEPAEDLLWLVDIEAATAELVANPNNLSGRSVDINALSIAPTGADLFFINKADLTLWQYDLVSPEE